MNDVDTGHGETRLDDLLADPIVQLLMRRDGVRRRDVEEMVDNLNLDNVRFRLTPTDRLTVPGASARDGRA